MFEVTDKNQSAPTAELVVIDAHSSSSQSELAANRGTHVPNPPSNWSDGDFAAGLRALESGAGVRGDFATGMRSTPLLLTTGDFATGQRTDLAPEPVRGDFATGQRTERFETPSPNGQQARRGHSPLWHSTVAVARRAS